MPVVEAVTPALIVGDASALTAQLEPPTAWMGATVAPVVAEFGVFQIRSLSRGGSGIAVEGVESGTGGANQRFQIDLDGVDPLAAPLAGVAVPQNTGPTPIQSTGRFGTTVTILGVDRPAFSRDSANTVTNPIFLPHGALLTWQCTQNNIEALFTFKVIEFPSAHLSPTG
jgi:hypothetical protein